MPVAFVAVVGLTRGGCLQHDSRCKQSPRADAAGNVQCQEHQRHNFEGVTHATTSFGPEAPYPKMAIFGCQLVDSILGETPGKVSSFISLPPPIADKIQP